MSTQNPNLLSEYVTERDFAHANNICQATVARYRRQGLPFLMFAGRVHIHIAKAHDWLANRTRQRNTRTLAAA